MYRQFNPNPAGKYVDDCVIRALCYALNESWDRIFIELSMQAFIAKDLPNANSVWGTVLYNKGFRQHLIYDICPDCFTIKDFCARHPRGLYVLATGSHVVAMEDGVYYDAVDSGNLNPIFYWKKENTNDYFR